MMESIGKQRQNPQLQRQPTNENNNGPVPLKSPKNLVAQSLNLQSLPLQEENIFALAESASRVVSYQPADGSDT
jgi:hypothetical protein